MSFFRESFWTRLVIFPFGNLLGVILFCVMMCPIFLVAALARPNGPPSLALRAAGVLIPVAAVVAIAIDVRCRSRQPGLTTAKRWFSPYEGATLVACPFWLIAAFLVLVTAVSFIGRGLGLMH